ncbi:MAG: hypothetical protein IT184_18045 [Acidobacteria bacterium]|nr:hypothetical protein [Acidobacteriota bacterium]
MLRIALLVFGGLLVLVDAVWFLQGIGALLGSPMTGQTRWQINGALAALGGLLIIGANVRRRRR